MSCQGRCIQNFQFSRRTLCQHALHAIERRVTSASKKTGLNLMHPYFVHIPDEPILFAAVAVGAREVTWEFYLQQNGGIEDDQFESIENLFNLLDLADRYFRISVGDIMDRTAHLDELHQAGGLTEIRRYFREEANSARRRRGENYWKTAILRALADSDDFCAGGHRLLG